MIRVDYKINPEDNSGFIFKIQPKKLSRSPAATAEPMTPATFGPMACMRR